MQWTKISRSLDKGVKPTIVVGKPFNVQEFQAPGILMIWTGVVGTGEADLETALEPKVAPTGGGGPSQRPAKTWELDRR